MHKYKNKNGIEFLVTTGSARVPAEADYYAYDYTVVAIDGTDLVTRHYKGYIEKRVCPSQSEADAWANNEAMRHLETVLETYHGGKTTVLIPATDGWWLL